MKFTGSVSGRTPGTGGARTRSCRRSRSTRRGRCGTSGRARCCGWTSTSGSCVPPGPTATGSGSANRGRAARWSGAGGPAGAVASVRPDPTVKPRMRMNDGKVDPLGRFWAGSMTLDKIPGSGALHLLAQGRMRTVLRGQTIPNGMAWTPDGGILYYIDTPERAVRRFRITGETELIDDGIAVRIAEGHGNPDGMCIDDEGMLWVALWGGRAVQRYRPDGQLIGRVDVPAAQVSRCALE